MIFVSSSTTTSQYTTTAPRKARMRPPAELHLPPFMRDGAIVRCSGVLDRGSSLFEHGPFTLRVALGTTQSARRKHYLDGSEMYVLG